jgi:hypothetical protein
LLKATERTTKTTYITIGNRVARRWVHVDLLMQLVMKKSILHVKPRDSPLTNRGHRNKSMNGGSMSNGSKGPLRVTTILMLKTTGNKTCIIVLNRAIRESLNLVDPLAHDRNSRRSMKNKIPSVGMLKSRNLLSHSG